MTNISLFPRPASWLSALLLSLFLGVWLTLLGQVAPRISALIETSPRAKRGEG